MTLGMVAVVLTTLLGFTGLAVDVANGYVARAILQHAVDDGALTAQRWSAQVDDPGADPSTVQNQAVAAALETARRDIEAQGLAGATAVEAAVTGSHLRIAARASIRTWFLRPLGVATLAPSASADTVLWTAAPSAGPPAGGAAEHPGEAP
ncbi:MAG TPA: pilus assembly protein TadG-related protein, partial [bacterium]|nr:pilus assembly protein TadG-related protein [bacterium]